MRLTPSSTARRNTAIASRASRGSPQMTRPVSRMAPKPRRWTGSSPPRRNVPLLVAGRVSTPVSPARCVLREGVMLGLTPAKHRWFRARRAWNCRAGATHPGIRLPNPRGAPFAALRSHEARRVHTHRADDGGGDHRSSGRDRDSEVDQPERTGAARRDEVRFAESGDTPRELLRPEPEVRGRPRNRLHRIGRKHHADHHTDRRRVDCNDDEPQRGADMRGVHGLDAPEPRDQRRRARVREEWKRDGHAMRSQRIATMSYADPGAWARALSTRRRILPEGDLGMASMTSIARVFLS